MEELLIKKLKNFFENQKDIELAYLFGSQARGKVGPLSDYDIAVLLKKERKDDYRYKYWLANEIAHILDTDRIDLIILNKVYPELGYNIISEGVRIYERDKDKRVDFESYILNIYLDFLPLLKKQKEDLLKGEMKLDDRGITRYREALRKTLSILKEVRDPEGKT